MEIQKEMTEKQKVKKEDGKNGLILKKIDQDSAKLLIQIRDKANKKSFGRKVRDSEIIAIALKQISAEHIRALQEETYSQKDRLAIAHEEYQKEHGKLSLDQFIGKLLKGELGKKN